MVDLGLVIRLYIIYYWFLITLCTVFDSDQQTRVFAFAFISLLIRLRVTAKSNHVRNVVVSSALRVFLSEFEFWRIQTLLLPASHQGEFEIYTPKHSTVFVYLSTPKGFKKLHLTQLSICFQVNIMSCMGESQT